MTKQPFLDTLLRGELLHWAHESGCILCRAAQVAVDRFFSWYLIEQYHEPSVIRYMQQAHGFCLEHTRQFVALATPDLVSAVYRDLFAAAIMQVRSVVSEVTMPSKILADRIRSKGTCLACQYRDRAVQRVVRALPTGLTDTEVRNAIVRPEALCLSHFLHLLPSLDWETIQQLAHAQLKSLMEVGMEDNDSNEPTRVIRLLVGADVDEAFFAPLSPSSMITMIDPQEADSLRAWPDMDVERSENASGERASWSPATKLVEAQLTAPGCPLCREEESVATTYLRWLSQQVPEQTSSRTIEEARWLCRDHLWRFVWIGEEQATRCLLRSIVAYWTGIMQVLTSGLEQPPSRSFVARCWYGMLEARKREPHASGWRVLQEGFAEGRRSRAERLAELRGPALQTRLCPVCHFQHEHVHRLADLLNDTLDDPGIKRCYEAASGLCFHHLPLLVERCMEPDHRKFILRTQQTRLAVLHWELEEYWRKDNWAHRWEAKGDEQTAWWRALMHYT
jgi:hypothetical protein